MSVQMITYDLRRPGQNYTELFNAIKSLGAWWHHLESVWLVNTSLTSTQIRDKLYPHLDGNDSLFVAGLNGDWGTIQIAKNGNDWLRTSLAS